MELGSTFGALRGQARVAYSGSFFVYLEVKKMNCDFKCVYEKQGECQQGGGECIRDCCPEYLNCDSCRRAEDCEV